MNVKFTIESNSNKKLDTFTKDIIQAIKESGSIKSGPIPFKGKRLIYCYNVTGKTIDLISKIKPISKLGVLVETFERPQ